MASELIRVNEGSTLTRAKLTKHKRWFKCLIDQIHVMIDSNAQPGRSR
jgi:hypothetical protein